MNAHARRSARAIPCCQDGERDAGHQRLVNGHALRVRADGAGARHEQLRRQERRLVGVLAPVARDAGMAARLAYSHLYRDHPTTAEADWQEVRAQLDAELQDG